MSTKSVCQTATFALLAACAMGAGADDKSDYDRRSAARYMSLFQSLDRNADGAVTRLEAQGDLNFSPRFNDMDINRDGVVTTAELQRYVDREHPTHSSGGQR
jgi:Ca2+-binding EF-hand superfamily protein